MELLFDRCSQLGLLSFPHQTLGSLMRKMCLMKSPHSQDKPKPQEEQKYQISNDVRPDTLRCNAKYLIIGLSLKSLGLHEVKYLTKANFILNSPVEAHVRLPISCWFKFEFCYKASLLSLVGTVVLCVFKMFVQYLCFYASTLEIEFTCVIMLSLSINLRMSFSVNHSAGDNVKLITWWRSWHQMLQKS